MPCQFQEDGRCCGVGRCKTAIVVGTILLAAALLAALVASVVICLELNGGLERQTHSLVSGDTTIYNYSSVLCSSLKIQDNSKKMEENLQDNSYIVTRLYLLTRRPSLVLGPMLTTVEEWHLDEERYRSWHFSLQPQSNFTVRISACPIQYNGDRVSLGTVSFHFITGNRAYKDWKLYCGITKDCQSVEVEVTEVCSKEPKIYFRNEVVTLFDNYYFMVYNDNENTEINQIRVNISLSLNRMEYGVYKNHTINECCVDLALRSCLLPVPSSNYSALVRVTGGDKQWNGDYVPLTISCEPQWWLYFVTVAISLVVFFIVFLTPLLVVVLCCCCRRKHNPRPQADGYCVIPQEEQHGNANVILCYCCRLKRNPQPQADGYYVIPQEEQYGNANVIPNQPPHISHSDPQRQRGLAASAPHGQRGLAYNDPRGYPDMEVSNRYDQRDNRPRHPQTYRGYASPNGHLDQHSAAHHGYQSEGSRPHRHLCWQDPAHSIAATQGRERASYVGNDSEWKSYQSL